MPAAAVIRVRQVLLVFNGSKGRVGGIVHLQPPESEIYNAILEFNGVTRTARGVYEYRDTRRDAKRRKRVTIGY